MRSYLHLIAIGSLLLNSPNLSADTVSGGSHMSTKMMLEHAKLMDLVDHSDVTRESQQSGNWSDATTWVGGILPADGDRVLIGAGHVVVVDQIISTKLMTIRVDGTLEFSTSANTSLTVDTLVVDPGGCFSMGTEANPIPQSHSARLYIEDYNNNGIEKFDTTSPDYDPVQLGLGLIGHGRIDMHGAPKVHGGTLLVEPSIGDTSIETDFDPTGWEAGDTIVIAGTTRDALGDEKRQITSIVGREIAFDQPLLKDHHTVQHTKAGLVLKVHVINLTRNVSVETVAAGQLPSTVGEIFTHGITGATNTIDQFDHRGHVMFMHSNDVSLKYAGFYGLGRTNKQTPADDTRLDDTGAVLYVGKNPRGRYSLHFHRAGISDTPAHVEGCAVEDSPGWGFVNHSSDVDFIENVAYNARGASFVTEVGDELGSFIENISIRNYADENWYSNNGTLRFRQRRNINDFAFAGHGFWYQGLNIVAKRNVASGAGREAIVIYPLPFDDVESLPLGEIPNPERFNNQDPVPIRKIPAHTFEDEVAYGSAIGLMVGEHIADFSSVLHGFTGWSIKMGLSTNYSRRVIYEETTLIGNLDTPDGVAVFAHHGSSDIEFYDSHIEGFTIGLQLPRGGNVTNRPRTHKFGIVENIYLNNLINIHFPLSRTHDSLIVNIINPTFGQLSTGAMNYAIVNLGEIADDSKLDIDASNNWNNGYEEFKSAVLAGDITHGYNYYFHYTSHPVDSEDSEINRLIHKRNFTLPHLFTVDLGASGTYQLYFKDVQDPSYVPFPSDLYTDGFSINLAAPTNANSPIKNSNIPAEFLDLTNKELSELFQLNADHEVYIDFSQSDDRRNRDRESAFIPQVFPNWSLSMMGEMLPSNYPTSSRFSEWADSYNVIAKRIDDLPDYKIYNEDFNTSALCFDFEDSESPLFDAASAITAASRNGRLPQYYDDPFNSTSAYFDGRRTALEFSHPIDLSYKTFTWQSNIRTLDIDSGVIFEHGDATAGYQIAIDNGQIIATVRNASGDQEIAGGTIQAGIWYHVALQVRNGLGQAILYLDGARVGAVDLAPIDHKIGTLARIGQGDGSFTRTDYYHGQLDDLCVLERPFTEIELESLHTSMQKAVIDQTLLDTDDDGSIDIVDPLPFTDKNFLDSDGDGIEDDWEIAHNLNPDDPADALTTTDNDGLVALLEYAFGTDPEVWDARGLTTVPPNSGIPIIHREQGPAAAMSVRFVRRKDETLNYKIEFSSDLSLWDATDATPTLITDVDADHEIVEVPFPELFGGEKGLFMRVNVSVQE